jgi:hypothetical protein
MQKTGSQKTHLNRRRPMEIDIQFRPSYSLAIVKLVANERIRADSGAIVSHSRR